MDEDIKLSSALETLVEKAILHAADSIGESGPLIPFVMSEGPKDEMARFIVDFDEPSGRFNLAESVVQARAAVRAMRGKAKLAVAIFDGFVTLPEHGKFDCFYLDAYERGNPHMRMICQRYRPAEDPKGFILLNDPWVFDEKLSGW